MTTITTRAGKGSPLTNDEVDANFTGLNTDKVETSGDSMTGNLSFGDNNKVILGTGNDLQIYHSGSHSIIDEAGTGDLYLRSTNGDAVLIYAGGTTSSKKRISANSTGEVELYYGSTARLATTSTGIDVTGTVTADGLTVDGNIAFSNASSSPQINSNLSLVFNVDADNNDPNDKGYFFRRHSAAENIAFFDENGDISFYEDTGTTAKFFWDSSAESLGIGTSSPAEPLHVQEGSSGITSKAGTVALIEGSANTKISIASGTTSTGSLLFGSSADNDAGRIVYDHSDDGLQLWTNGARAVDIDSSGNLLVNGTNPTAKLVVDGDANAYTARFNSSTTAGQAFGTRIRAGTSSSDYALLVENTSAASMLAVRGDGNVGIGTSTPQASIHTTGDAIIGTATHGTSYEGVLQIADGAVNERTVVLIYNNHPDQFMKLGQDVNTAFIGRDQADEFAVGVFDNAADTTLSKQFVIDANGNVLIATTDTFVGDNSTGGGISFASGGAASFARSAGKVVYVNRTGSSPGEAMEFRYNGGDVGNISVTSSATGFNTSSDQRLKDNIVDAPSASDDIDAIQVRSFDWRADGSHQKYGMVAQELQSVAPEAVSEGETEDDMMGVDYSKLVPMLVKEIQSLRARVAQLEGEN